jgi:hypothetical protein
MDWQICKKDKDTIIITIEDDELNSADKEAFLDLVLNRTGGDSWGSWGTRYINSNAVEYHIPKKIWDMPTFQEKYFFICLML